MDYDDSRHEYSENGIIIPSVTQILYGSSSAPWFSKESSDRGHRAHELCAAYALDPSDKFLEEPYVDAFVLWCSARNPEWIAIEEMIDGMIDGFRFAGRFDGLAILDGILTLVDWKTGVKSKKFRAQLGGYSLVPKPTRAMVLYLRPDSTYEEVILPPAELVQGIQEFRAAIRTYYAQAN
jgi:hypothetical protein